MNVDRRDALRYTCPVCSARVRTNADGSLRQCRSCGYDPAADDVVTTARETRTAMDGRGPRGW